MAKTEMINRTAVYRCKFNRESYFVDHKVSIPKIDREKPAATNERFRQAAVRLNNKLRGCWRSSFYRFK